MIYFVGQLPPPVHGFSFANKSVLDCMLRLGLNCRVFDLTPRRQVDPIFRWLRYFWLIILEHKSITAIYMPLSGGYRQLIELLFVLVGTIFKIPIFVHHHSYAYLNNPRWYSRVIFYFLRGSRHIVLGKEMGVILSRVFFVPSLNISVISNSAYLTVPVDVSHKKSSNILRVGFLSNITREKGIFLFFEALRSLRSSAVKVEAYIAGPISEGLRDEFYDVLSEFSNVKYFGPLYGDVKDRFYSNIDLFLFPTLYKNEAEPVVIWEALRAGVPVLALNRGCISSVLTDGAGWVVDGEDEFLRKIVSLFCDAKFFENFSIYSSAASRRFKNEREESLIRLNRLFVEMS